MYTRPSYLNYNYGDYGLGYDVVQADILESKVVDLIEALKAGNAPERNVSVTTALLAPPTERIAFLQAAWWTAKASRLLGGAAGKAPLTERAQEYLDDSKSASRSVNDSIESIQAPINDAATFISQYGMKTIDIVSNLRMAGAEPLISDTKTDVVKYSGGTVVSDATAKTISDIGKPFKAVADFFTSDSLFWKTLRYGAIGLVAIGVVGYAAKNLNELKGEDDDD